MGILLKIATFGWAMGITLAPFGIYVKDLDNARLVNHEKIHWKQQMEMLIIPFYLWYLFEFLGRLVINGKKAYMKLLFEREAHDNDNNLDYLKTRKHFVWL